MHRDVQFSADAPRWERMRKHADDRKNPHKCGKVVRSITRIKNTIEMNGMPQEDLEAHERILQLRKMRHLQLCGLTHHQIEEEMVAVQKMEEQEAHLQFAVYDTDSDTLEAWDRTKEEIDGERELLRDEYQQLIHAIKQTQWLDRHYPSCARKNLVEIIEHTWEELCSDPVESDFI